MSDIDLKALNPTLTKHGAYKLAKLLEQLPVSKVLRSVGGVVDGVNIDSALVRRLLSVGEDGTVPDLWAEVKAAGPAAVRGMVLLAILFSHHLLIDVLKTGSGGAAQGEIRRDYFGTGKPYSNLKRAFIELGFATFDSPKVFGFDLRRLILDKRMGVWAKSLFSLKMKDAGWKGGDVVETATQLEWHDALGLKAGEFAKWLSDEALTPADKAAIGKPDSDEERKKPFKFKPGHNPKKTGTAKRPERVKAAFATLLHNQIQNIVFDWLVAEYGEDNVSTENLTGSGDTAIDIARISDSDLIFYEIKTASSLKTCIRDALSQLMEYAYWPAEKRARELVILSPNPPTKDAKAYLLKLRTEFALPIYHETVDMKTGALGKRM